MLETGTEERPERLAAATACGANEGLELREAALDGIEVRAIGWQVPEGGPGGLDDALDAGVEEFLLVDDVVAVEDGWIAQRIRNGKLVPQQSTSDHFE